MQKKPMTVQGAEKLREELNTLKTVERPRVINAISEARAHGDLKENAEYHAAREQQGFIEGRIKEIEASLSYAQIIDVTSVNANGKIIFGSTVELLDLDTEQTIEYHIVGEDESDIKNGKLSIASPIARALIGKTADDEVSLTVPGGKREFEIIAVHYR
jgi:transcription elongation factor GreA